MKAMVYSRYGPPSVVTQSDLPKPTPHADEVLIQIHATTVTSGDWRARSLNMPPGFRLLGRLVFGVVRPRKPVLGTELAGVVEAVGQQVTHFKPGDEVFAFTGAAYGCHAEYRTIPEAGMIALKPANLSFEEAAALGFGGGAALYYLRDKGKVQPGETVLIIGASGGVGSAAVQVAKHLGGIVTGVTSTANLELVRSLGADEVIDYTHQDFATRGETYDVILDTTGTTTFARAEPVMRPGGRLILVQGSFAQSMGLDRPPRHSDKQQIAGVVNSKPQDMQTLANLAASGALRPLIGRRYGLAQAAEAHAYVDTGRKIGNVVLTVEH